MTRVRNKLSKLNIPELFYNRFLSIVPIGESEIVDILHNTNPTPRGRGLTRVLKNLTNHQWNDIYQRAAVAREAIKKKNATGAVVHREDTLFPAICAKTLAERMEVLGVDNPVAFTGKTTIRRTKAEILKERQQQETDPAPVVIVEAVKHIPVDPPRVDRVNIPESTPAEQQSFQDNMLLGNFNTYR